jgi:RES domain
LRTPGPLPSPPARLHERDLPILELSRHWCRSHPIDLGPVYYGRSSRYRFDDPEGEYGVFYVAEDPFGAFAETFGQLMSTKVSLPRMISTGALATRALSSIVPSRPLRLVDLTGPGLARIGADARLFAGDHQKSQQWSRALREHPVKADGLYYPIRHDPSRKAAAIFNDELTWTELSRDTWLALSKTLRDILQAYGFSLIESISIQSAVKKGPRSEQTRFPFGG